MNSTADRRHGSLFRRLRGVSVVFLACLLLLGAARAEEPDPALLVVDDSIETQSRVEDLIDRLTLHEKICQLFFVQPEQFSRLDRVTAFSTKLASAFTRFPVGGIILFGPNMTEKSLAALNAGMQQASLEAVGIGLLIGADEEGGSVSRVAGALKLPEKQPAPSRIGTPEEARESARIIGTYLARYGINVDFAPVADVRSDVERNEIAGRSYGSDPENVARMVAGFTEALHECGVIPVLKHFPGHGAVSGNTHSGSGISVKTLEDWRKTDFVPFAAGIRAEAEMVMISHQTAVAVDPDSPASLSPAVIGLLRQELGFEGVIITDALRMKAVHEPYGSGEACVRALEAGADMLLLPYNFTAAYESVLKAVQEGRLSEDRIDESLLRILNLKERYGLLPFSR